MTPRTAAYTVAVVGTPNVGKSTLFNVLTGLQQRVGNFPGVTVEPMVGTVTWNGASTTVLDLPGIYSLDAASEDERLSCDVLLGRGTSVPRPDAILHVVNGASIAKSLALHAALANLGLPMIVVVTMIDEVKATGGVLDDIALQHELGVPVLGVVGTRGLGVNDVRMALADPQAARIPTQGVGQGAPAAERLAWATGVERQVLVPGTDTGVTRRLDSVLLHPMWGSVAFVLILTAFFQSIFTWANPLMDGIEAFVGVLQDVVAAHVPAGLLQNFLAKGILAGIGSVIVFLPQIVILNILITVLEECGYLARAAFIVDRYMGLFGLQGRSFIPLLGSFACAIPGIMSARIIPSYRDRIATIMAAPFMACSARLPVYALIIGAVIPATTVLGVFSLQGVVLAALFAVGALSGLLVALALKRTMFRGSVVPFLIEFPPYRLPSLRSVGLTVVNRSRDFLTTAGTVILAFSIALWILTELPRTSVPPGTPPLQAAQMQLEGSYAATIGKTVQPAFAPLGFDWRVTLGVLGSYAARETFVGVMGQVYAADVAESDAGLRDVLQREIALPTGLAILAFYVYALQCVSTMAVMKRETGSWKWPALAFGITLALAYVAALVARMIGDGLV